MNRWDYERSWIAFVEQEQEYGEIRCVLKLEVSYLKYGHRFSVLVGLFVDPLATIQIAEQFAGKKDVVSIRISPETIDTTTYDYEVIPIGD